MSRYLFLLIFGMGLVSEAWAQSPVASLTNQLAKENPDQLAKEAREKGNIVRGAILFHQGNINCAKCHRPQAEAERIGPDLSRMESEITDASIIESILYPSKQIKKGYETSIILTADGETINGMVLQQDENQIVVRDRADIDNLVTLPREEVEAIRPGKLSNMPDKLADQLKDRQQFLDLIRYVFDLRERGPAKTESVNAQSTRRRLSPALEAHVAVEKYRCTVCHASDSDAWMLKEAPRLEWSAKHLNPQYLATYIANPLETKPGTTMPDVMGKSSATERRNSAQAITHYLVSQTGNSYQPKPVETEAVARGYELFHAVGCVACHSPRDENARELEMPESTAMGDLGQKYDLEGLVEFLENPLAVRASGHMPSMKLLRRESTDLASFLLQSASTETGWNLEPALAEKGKALFSSLNCVACHGTVIEAKAPARSRVSFEELRPNQGCLSNEPGKSPRFQMLDSERQAIEATLNQPVKKFSNEEQISLSLRRFNCLACHQRDDLGGVPAERNPHFKTTNLNLGDQGRIPPTLTNVGAKLNTKWLRDVMVNGRSIRPYMKTRMPQFGESNIQHLFELFESTDRLPQSTKFAEFKDQKKMRETGLQLAGNRGLNCVACHTYRFQTSDTMPAVDLTEMTERLKKDWFYQYMLDPQRFSPNTVMPSFWPNGKAIRTDLSGSPEEQVEAIWQYLIDGRQARAPRGVVRESLEIVVQDEAVLLRRAYPNIGKRGIGVGYPGGINIAYDAEQMRLALIWKGRFADPGGVWRGQGSGQVRPMSRPLSFAKGPDVDSDSAPWKVDDGRPPKHQFKGYSLDEKQRPTFRYQFGSVLVEDFFQEVRDGDQAEAKILRRTVKLSSQEPVEGIRFQIAMDRTKETNRKAVQADGDFFPLGSDLRVKMVSGPAPRRSDESQESKLGLFVPVALEPNQPQQLIFEYHWK